MRFRVLLLFLLLLTSNSSCVGPGTTQDGVGLPPVWAYDSIQFEIAPVTSAALPEQEALEWFRDQLHTYRVCDRSHVSFVIQAVDTEPCPPVWNQSLLSRYTTRRRAFHDLDTDDRRLCVFVPYLMGSYHDFTGIRILGGIQYQHAAFAVFNDGAGAREPAVLLHEFGHMIGLAQDATHGNIDAAHGSHCATATCVMYWSTPARYAVFDGYCMAFLRDWLVERTRPRLY